MGSYFADVGDLDAHIRVRVSPELETENYSSFRELVDEGSLSLAEDSLGVLLDVLDFHTEDTLSSLLPDDFDDYEESNEGPSFSTDLGYDIGEDEWDERNSLDGITNSDFAEVLEDWVENFGIGRDGKQMFFQGFEDGESLSVETLVKLVNEWFNAQGSEKRWNPYYAPELNIDPRILKYAKDSSSDTFLDRFCYDDKGIVSPLTCWEMAECLRLAYSS